MMLAEATVDHLKRAGFVLLAVFFIAATGGFEEEPDIGVGGWVLLAVLAILFVAFPFRLRGQRIKCPKCGEHVVPKPGEDSTGEDGGECPDCGEWFSLDTWHQMTA